MRALVLGLALVSLFACQKKEDYIKVSCPSEKQLVEGLKKFNPELYIKIEKVQQFDKVPPLRGGALGGCQVCDPIHRPKG